MTCHTYTFKALTNLWTGDINGKPDRLIATGLLGSIRWWYEVAARGLGGKPCDPSSTACIDRKHCVVCEFFGCTGWARKFRFDVLDHDKEGQQTQIEKGQTFKLRFTPLRSVRKEEWALLDLTLRLIAEHGAIGGKTVFKPSDEDARCGETHHKDFGLIELSQPMPMPIKIAEETLRSYANNSKWRSVQQNGFAWASLSNFWSVPGQCLARQTPEKSTFNDVIGRDQPKKSANTKDSWLAGRRAQSKPLVRAESKKVFSFRDPPRTFGFVNPSDGPEQVTLDTIKERLEAAWQKGKGSDEVQILSGPQILNKLLSMEET